MWFGDLVTMKWWNGIWLNEAFATFMELTTVDAFRPEWERWVSFSTERAVAMVTDGLASTRPIEYEVVSPDDAEGMFDVLTYQKGGAVLRMLETVPRRRTLPRRHPALPRPPPLRQHRDHRPVGRDRGGQRRAGPGDHGQLDLPGRSPGRLGVVERARRACCKQQRFRYTARPGRRRPAVAGPGTAAAGLGPARSGAAERTPRRRSASAARAPPSSTPAAGACTGRGTRRRCSPTCIAHLDDLDALERFNLVSDTWAEVLAGQVGVDGFLDLVALLGDERDPSVWEAALDGLGACYRAPARSGGACRRGCASLIRPVFDSLGWVPGARRARQRRPPARAAGAGARHHRRRRRRSRSRPRAAARRGNGRRPTCSPPS